MKVDNDVDEIICNSNYACWGNGECNSFLNHAKFCFDGGDCTSKDKTMSKCNNLECCTERAEFCKTFCDCIRGTKYLVFDSSLSVKLGEFSFAVFVYFLGKIWLNFNFLNGKIHNYVIQWYFVTKIVLTYFEKKLF